MHVYLEFLDFTAFFNDIQESVVPHLFCFPALTGDLYYVRNVIVLMYWWNCNYIMRMQICSVVHYINMGVYMYTMDMCIYIAVTNACNSIVLYHTCTL